MTYIVSFTDLDKKYGLPEGFLNSMCWQESRYNWAAVSPVGAKGYFQFMPKTREEFMQQHPGLDPWSSNQHEAAECAAIYMNCQMKRFDGDILKAASAYNAGGGNVHKAITHYGDDWLGHLTQETQNYGKQILARIGMTTKEWADDLDFTKRWTQHPGTVQPGEVDEQLKKRHDVLEHLVDEKAISQDQVDKMSKSDILGVMFLAIVASFVKNATEQQVSQSQAAEKPVVTPTLSTLPPQTAMDVTHAELGAVSVSAKLPLLRSQAVSPTLEIPA